MSYQGISVKEAMDNINNSWYLPAIQRPFVWGSRYENEMYICKLFDSILKGYPIGGLIIWNTAVEVPYREFISNYIDRETQKLVDQGLWSKNNKGLVYDGQQRLQTLYSCLKYTFNGKILVYDVLFDLSNDSDDTEETGFSFVNKHSTTDWNLIRMNELFAHSPDQDKRTYRKKIIKCNPNITEEEDALVEKNVDKLWSIFVEIDKKSLSHFSILTSESKIVTEVFQRLNTGGIPLSLGDLLFTKIKDKDKNFDFEEKLQDCSNKIFESTGNGYIFDAYSILQLLHLIVKKRVRIDQNDVSKSEIDQFTNSWDKLEKPLISFFTDYLWGQYKINHNSIVPRKLALLPIIVYFYEVFNKGFKFTDFSSENLKKINQYFLKSQINDWNLQSHVDNFTKTIIDESLKKDELFEFPLKEIENHIYNQKRSRRNIDILEQSFTGYVWFTLKILTPNRMYQFAQDIQRRFKPEIDHIFPRKLKDETQEYFEKVDIIWNMQPIKGEINNHKKNIHPKDFFTDNAKNSRGESIIGSTYLSDYDFIPKDFNDDIWDRPIDFIEKRRIDMINFLKEKYDIILKTTEE